MEKDTEDYIQQLEKRIVLLEGRVAILEARVAGLPTPSYPNRWHEPPSMPSIPIDTFRCPVCQIEMKGAWGYVCNHPKCPTIPRATM